VGGAWTWDSPGCADGRRARRPDDYGSNVARESGAVKVRGTFDRRTLAPLWVLTIVVGIVVAASAAAGASQALDPYSYWTYRLDGDPWRYPPNATIDGVSVSHPYTPAFAQLLAPLQVLPFPVFAGLWTALAYGGIVLLLGRWAGLAVLLLPPLAHEMWNTNVAAPLALVATFGFRWPALWAIPLLTKLTPGIGVLWFAFRREWRNLGMALGVTGGVIAVSFALDPGAWVSWSGWLVGHATGYDNPGAIAIPLLLRLPVAVALLAWGARTDRRWTVPLAVWLALPQFSWEESVILLAVIPLSRSVAVDRHREVVVGDVGAVAPDRLKPARRVVRDLGHRVIGGRSDRELGTHPAGPVVGRDVAEHL